MLTVLIGLAAALAWGVHDLLVRRISQGSNVLGQIAMVAAVGAVILAGLGGSDLALMSPRALVFAGLAGFGYVLAYLGLYRAFALAPVRVVSPVLGAFPLLSLLAAALSGAEVTPADWLAVAAVVAGIAVVATAGRGRGSRHRSAARSPGLGGAGGDRLCRDLCAGASGVAGRSVVAGGADHTRLVALLCILAVMAVQRPSLQPVWQNWRILVCHGVLDTAALALVMLAGGWPNAEYAAVAASLFGVVTILLAWRFLGEAVRPVQWLGIGLVFSGIGWLAV